MAIHDEFTPKQAAALRDAPPAQQKRMMAIFRNQKRANERGNADVQRRRRNRISQPQGLSRRAPNARHTNAQGGALSGAQLRDIAWQVTPASANVVAPRGHGYYDAFANHPSSAMTYMSIGPATPISAVTVGSGINTAFGLPIGTTDQVAIQPTPDPRHAQLIVVNPAPDRTQAVRFWVEWDTGIVPPDFALQVSSQQYNASALPSGYNSGAPATKPDLKDMIPSRCSVRIRNTSAGMQLGGTVRILRMTTGFSLIENITSSKEYWELIEGIREHTRTVRYDGRAFTEGGLQKNCTVCDQSKALHFQDYALQRDYDEIMYPYLPKPPSGTTTYDVYNWQLSHAEPAFTPIAILIEPFAAASGLASGAYWSGNTYDFNVNSQFLAHYYQGTMLANMAANPRNDQRLLNSHRNKEESFGSSMHRVLGDIIHGAQQLPWGQIAGMARPALQALM